MTTPAITVLMTVYNGQTYLREAIDSILTQSHRDFELLIINDGSKDASLALLQTITDPRIRLIDQQPNRGIRATLNRGLREARGRYLALMDQDDISAPQRLEHLLARMESQPDLALCGSAIEPFGDRALASWVRYFEPAELQVALLFENPICHPSMMLRRSVLTEHALEYPDVPYAEEYALWVALSRVGQLANLPQPLLRYRVHPHQVSRTRNDIQCESMSRVLLEQLAHLGITATARELILHKMLGGVFNPLPGYRHLLEQWTARLLAANLGRQVYPGEVFTRQVQQRLRATLALNQEKLESLRWRQRLAWRFSVWRDFHRATLPALIRQP